MSSLRSEKIADELRKEISLIINKETKDPRLQKINITAVKVSDDIGVANVFYTVIGESINIVESEINPKILKKICPGVYGTITPIGYCMIGKR